MVPVSLGLQSKQRVVATAAVAERRETPKPIRMGNMVTMSSIAKPEALLIHRPMSIPTNLAKLMDDEKKVATDKGWTLA